jgi:hypothetical protein
MDQYSCFSNPSAILEGIPLDLVGDDELVAEATFGRGLEKPGTTLP